MKPLHAIIIFCLTVQCSGYNKQAKVGFENKELNFNSLHRGEKFKGEFIFYNSGNAPLVIEDVTADCGCNSISFTQEEIHEKAYGKITVIYDSESDKGDVVKTITVRSNTIPKINVLYIKGNVLDR